MMKKLKENKNVEMWKIRLRPGVSIKKRGQPLTLSPKLTHESTLLFYNSFCLPFIVIDQLENVQATRFVGYVYPVHAHLANSGCHYSSVSVA